MVNHHQIHKHPLDHQQSHNPDQRNPAKPKREHQAKEDYLCE